MNQILVHDNIFIAAGRQLGYVLTQTDILEIRNRHKLTVDSNVQPINDVMQAAICVVRQYINSCMLKINL